MTDPHPGSTPEDLAQGNPDSANEAREDDPRSDIEQAVQARSDAVARGEGGNEPETFTATGDHDGVGGTGGEVRNQDMDQQ